MVIRVVVVDLQLMVIKKLVGIKCSIYIRIIKVFLHKSISP